MNEDISAWHDETNGYYVVHLVGCASSSWERHFDIHTFIWAVCCHLDV